MKKWKKTLGIVLTAAAVAAAAPVGAGEPVESVPVELGITDPDAPVSHTPGLLDPGIDPGPVEAVPERILPDLAPEAKVKWADRVIIALDNKVIAFDQEPVVTPEGILLVPLRAVVEAAGGTVEWQPETRTVSVTVAERTALFTIGSRLAKFPPELGQGAVEMAKAPVILAGRTLISEDALARVLGLVVKDRESDFLNLVLPPAAAEEEQPAEGAEEESRLTGTIKEIRAGERKILVEGGPMASGEPSLTWVTLFEDTELSRGAEGESITLADLEIGQEVEVVVSGAILMSYPAQAGASAVVVSD